MQRLALGLALAASIAAAAAAGPQLRLAFEDRGDPRPHQFALRAEIAGLGAGLIISWSARGARIR